MLKSPNIPSNYGFGIWFNKKEKREYYVTPLVNCQVKFYKNINFKYGELLLTTESPKFKKPVCDVIKNDYYSPMEERYGMFLIKFLNADFTDVFSAYKTFFAFYGIEFLKEYVDNFPDIHSCKTANDYLNLLTEVFKNSKENLISLQKDIRECVDFTYNLDNSNSYNDVYPHIRYLSHALKNDLYRYTNNTNVYFNKLFVNGTDGLSPNLANPTKVSKSIKDGKLTYKLSNIYHSTALSNIVFISLDEIALNTYVTIKKCQNCSKYFIPISKESEIYCDIMYYDKEKTCRVKGAAETFKKNIGDVEAYKLYKKTYQKILMQIQRGKTSPYSEKAKYFTQWKQQSQQYLKRYKKGSISENDLNEWMQKSVDKFDKYKDNII